MKLKSEGVIMNDRKMEVRLVELVEELNDQT